MNSNKSILCVALAVTLLSFFSTQYSCLATTPIELLVTTDAGCDIDDQFVLTHLLTSKAFHIVGIVTTHAPNLFGNDITTTNMKGKVMKPAEITARQVREVLAQLPAKVACPVYIGSSVALPTIHSSLSNDGVKFIINTAKPYDRKHRLTVLSLGAATDIASALNAAPALQNKIQIVAIGFDTSAGKDGFNVQNDVKAWQALLESNTPITIADGEVTIANLSMDRELSQVLFNQNGRLGKYLDGLVQKWLRRNPALCKQTTGRDAWPIWDEAVVAYLLKLTKSKTMPRPQLQDDTSLIYKPTARTIQWITAIDSQALWKNLGDNLQKCD